MHARVLVERFMVSFVVCVLMLVFASSRWSYAAGGGNFTLGRANNANTSTRLTSSSSGGPSLVVANSGGKPAAAFMVKAGVPPFKVSSNAKVANLNAALLGGVAPAGFYRAGSKVADSTLFDGQPSSAYQQRIRNSCSDNSAISNVNSDGSVGCAPIPQVRAWNLAGNDNSTNDDFLGTIGDQALFVKTNSKEAMRIDEDQNITIAETLGVGTSPPVVGLSPPAARLQVSGSPAGSSVALLASNSPGQAGRAIVGTLGVSSCPSRNVVGYGVGGCAGPTEGFGVEGMSDVSTGVYGESQTGDGIEAHSGSGAGLVAVSTSGNGVDASNDSAAGVNNKAAVVANGASGGNLFLGFTGGQAKVRVDGTGKGFFDGGTQSGGADYAESIHATESASRLAPGDVLTIDLDHPNRVRKSASPNSTLVAGVYSTKPSVLAVGNHRVNDALRGEVPVAMLGIVPTKVSAENGAIQPGDLLTTSSTPGYAMEASGAVVGGVKVYPTGTILGKALGSLKRGKGTIQVLIMLR